MLFLSAYLYKYDIFRYNISLSAYLIQSAIALHFAAISKFTKNVGKPESMFQETFLLFDH